MTIKAECTECGRDCTELNGTDNGGIYCMWCLPLGPRKRTLGDAAKVARGGEAPTPKRGFA